MTRCVLLAALAAAAGPCLARADDPPPERLLFASTQVFARWDGVAAHRDAYAQTTVGKLLSDDVAPLVKHLTAEFPRLLQSELVDNKLLNGLAPDRLAALQRDVIESGKVIDILTARGLVVGGEIGFPNLFRMAVGAAQQYLQKSPEAGGGSTPVLPRMTATVVVPGAAADAGPLFSLLRLYARAEELEFKEEAIARRSVLHFKLGLMHLSAWTEGPHVVACLSTEPPAALVARLDSAEARLESAALYQRMREAATFRTDVRGFVDVDSLVRLARAAAFFADPEVARFIDAVGLGGVESVVYSCGFEGPTRREVIEVAAPGPRKGLLRLFGRAPLDWATLPPLPPDVSKWSAHRIDPQALYSVLVDLIDRLHPVEENPAIKPEKASERVERALGIALKEEVIDQLGSLFVTYHSPAEGGFTLGQVIAIEVTNGEKVLQALDLAVQGQIVGNNLRIKRRPFLDGEIRELTFERTRGAVQPSYTVYKNWLLVSLYPQPLQGFIQRSAGRSKSWQQEHRPEFAGAAKSTSWAYNDPRAGAQQMLTFGPLIVGAIAGDAAEPTVEAGLIPSGSVVLQKLTPNYTTLKDDGTVLRWDTRGGLLLPLDALGLDPVMLFVVANLF